MLDSEISIGTQFSSGLIDTPPDENFFRLSDPGSGSAILNKNGDFLDTSAGMSPEAMPDEALVIGSDATVSVLSAGINEKDSTVAATNALDTITGELSSVETSASELSELKLEDADKIFDADCYAAMNPDLGKAGITTPQQLYEHFKDAGLNEGRDFSPLLNLNFYRVCNPDLVEAGITSNQQLYEHWQKHGIAEGRSCSPFVDLKYYLKNNPDLAEVFGEDTKLALDHLQNYGVGEGRNFSPWVNLKYYLENNPDLVEAFGENYKLALEHLQQYGVTEGRKFSPAVDLDFYLNNNADLAAAFGNNKMLAFEHWQKHGFAEGRKCCPNSADMLSGEFLGGNGVRVPVNLGNSADLGNESATPAISGDAEDNSTVPVTSSDVEDNPTVPAISGDAEDDPTVPVTSSDVKDNPTVSAISGDAEDNSTVPVTSTQVEDDATVPVTSSDVEDNPTVPVTESNSSTDINEGNATPPATETPVGEKLTPTVTPPKTLSGLEAEPTPPMELPENAGGKNSKKNPSPKHFQFKTTKEEYLNGETVRLNDAWAFDASGAGDLERVEFSLRRKDNKECQEVENATNFLTSSKDDRWGWLNYQISGLAPGEYQLKGVAYDKAGGKSNTAVTSFTVSETALVTPLLGFIDSGFAAKSPDLDYSRLVLGKDWVDGDDNPLIEAGEGNEHGTFMLGLVAAIQNNGTGIYGMNDHAKLWLGRAIGSGKWAESLMEFVDYAKQTGQSNAIVNLSLDLTQVEADGSIKTRYEFTPREREALEYARQNGVLIVAAAGNDGDVMSVLGQASQEFDNIITAGAANGIERAAYSSYGDGLDILAEGGSISEPVTSTVGDDVGNMAGTSVAAAQVTGAASLLWEANTELNYRQVIEVLKSSATDLNVAGWDKETGAGLLNTEKAVEVAKLTMPEEYMPTAFLTPDTWQGEGEVSPSERAVEFNYSITNESFSGSVAPIGAPYYGVSYRRSPEFEDRWGEGIAAESNTLLEFDAWTWGEVGQDFWYNNDDALWYRLKDTDYWVPSVYINGYPPSQPSLLPPSNLTSTGSNEVSIFSGTVIATIGAIVRDEATISSAEVGSRNYRDTVEFDAWKIGDYVDYSDSLGTASDRWYRIAGTDDWISAAIIDGVPGSQGADNNNSSSPTISSIAQQYQMGNPTSDVILYSGNISYQLFDKGSVVSSQHGIFPLYGGIRQEYLNTGGLNGPLGAPTSAETGIGNGVTQQTFEGGYIIWNGSTATAYYQGDLPNVIPPTNTPSTILTAQDFGNWSNWAEYTSRNPFPSPGQNCTWYAHGRMMQLGYSEYALDSMLGDAGTWDDTAARGATVTYTPQVPCIAVWDPYTGGAVQWGHVAVVEQINPDGSILISESNWNNTAYGTRTLYQNTLSWPSKFITVPKA
ncbi:S8 family serine peptidase [Microcoleus sp. FACHB-68]|uniref:S8 family serine peptidase n=1 Tax=Microcoleus sp. FACHB-68 TaxID=2692826 RepID=UPI0016884EAC|nr:S8 family serine peptidase [Microcoleus sp. FACHB-68]MBD1938312.1 S8 family serine peptidase [Microcoleus sp. FACHB-68]